ncbi:MAG TPA: ATP-dependent RNA helicase HrpA [Mycobacteriales bacterium]|nr:ATP-dependent RNA helicase HrpA [Mycobacteriales bacterium]
MPTQPPPPPLAGLRARLPEMTLRDQHRLRRRIDGAGRIADPQALAAAAEKIGAEVDAACLRLDRRRQGVPPVSYPGDLPISQRRDEIAAAVRDHQVVIVAGETGSGKTTQLPKICLELGRGPRGMIGHTQPRRLAARTVAERIAEELGTPLGGAVGYQVRFTDRVGEDTLVKLMTDGILLAEIGRDRSLRRYDTLIIDEAHERSLNVDFILGYLGQLLPRRPDLKVIITSATIDPQRFSRHFGGAPVIEVSGRSYPVEVRYRPIAAEDADTGDGHDGHDSRDVRDQPEAICDAVDELSAEGPGDILVFCSGEREIRDTADALGRNARGNIEILPLYARLSVAEQHRVFAPHTGRRVVLATNVAETSLTVPGIRYVVDPGTARISRYSHRTKVQRLPIEPVSQASANQRAGRCGRTSEGICIRLYTEQDFAARPEFTDPEILRTNLASVILQMAALGLGDVAEFPFVDPPDRRSIADGVALLVELGALEASGSGAAPTLTPLGRKLAQFPVDPRLARMLLEADRNGCVREVAVIVAALSIQDPRERPVDHRPAADERHGRFADPQSDFLTFLNLWNYLREQQKQLSSNQFRRLCRADFLNYLRVREWQDIHSQLRQVAASLGISMNSQPAAPQRVHTSLLAGLLSHIGVRDVDKPARSGPSGRASQEYLGARSARFAVFPGSALFARPPRWVMAAELVETSRLWARVVARIEPEWVEPLAAHLVRRQYSEPHWDAEAGAVMALERVTLYGVPIVVSRPVNYARVDPALCRELFIRHALVEGDWRTHHRFYQRNRELLDEVAGLEDRIRRRDIVVDADELFAFYDKRVGAGVVSARHFDSWWKKTRRTSPNLLDFDRDMLVTDRVGTVSQADYPDTWAADGVRLRLSYRFEPGTAGDGVTVDVPLPVLNRVSGSGFDWQVPGLREELVTALIRSLRKPLRRAFVPAPDHARAALARLTPGTEPLTDALGRELHRLTGVAVPAGAWRPDQVPDHLRMTFRVTDEAGRTLAEGKDLAALAQRLRPTVQRTISATPAAAELERHGLRTWTLGDLPRVVEQRQDGHLLRGYPALVDEGDAAGVRVFGNQAEAGESMGRGTRRLLLCNVASPVRYVAGRLSNRAKLTLTANPHGSLAALLDDCVACATDALVAGAGGPAWDPAGFDRLLDAVRAGLNAATLEVVSTVERVLVEYREVIERLDGLAGRPTAGALIGPSLADVRGQLAGLVRPGFVAATGWPRVTDLPRYLRAAARRLDKLPEDPFRDQDRTASIERVAERYQQARDRLRPGQPVPDGLREVRWMIEELRVSYFAQALGTAYPISEKRILRTLT